MKLQLNYEFPEEKEEFEMAYNGSKYYCVLWDFKDYLRSKRKYEDKDTLTIEELYEKLTELEAARGILE